MPPKKKLKPEVGQRSMISFMTTTAKPSSSETSSSSETASTSSTSVDLESEIIVDNTSTTDDNPVIVVETGMDMTSVVCFLLLLSTSK